MTQPTANSVFAPRPPTRITVPQPDPPAWLAEYATNVEILRDAGVGESDWNGHGARPLQDEAIELGFRILASLLHRQPARPFPAIVPSYRGGLIFEWRVGDRELDIDVDPNGSVEVMFVDHRDQNEWDGTLTERESDVHRCLDRMARTEASDSVA